MQIQKTGQNHINPSMKSKVDIGEDVLGMLDVVSRQYVPAQIKAFARVAKANVNIQSRISGNSPYNINCTVTPEGKHNSLLRDLWYKFIKPEKIVTANLEQDELSGLKLIDLAKTTIFKYNKQTKGAATDDLGFAQIA